MAKFTFGTFEEVSAPNPFGDFLNRDHLVPGAVKLVASGFPYHRQVVAQASAAAAAAATSIPVDAVPSPYSGATIAIPSGAVLDFAGTGELAKVTANVAPGATSIAVEALDAGIEDNDAATYVPLGAKRYVPRATVIGRTYAERDAGTGYGPADAADDETFLLAFSIADVDDENDGVLYRPGSIVKENLMPEVIAGTLAAGVLADVRARYVCQRGIA